MKSSNWSAVRAWRAMILVLLAIPLSGCVALAAAPLMMGASLATTGFFGYKLFQTASGSEVGVELPNERIEPQASQLVSGADTLAFWTSSDRSLVVAAEQVEQAMGFASVITPSNAARIIRDNDLPAEIDHLTTQERRAAFEQFAAISGADLVLAIRTLGVETDANTFSFSRAAITMRSRVHLYSRDTQSEIWVTEIDLIVGMGNDSPSEDELEDVLGRAIADRLNDIATGNTTQTGDAS